MATRRVVTVESREINSVSKSKLMMYDKCPLKAYKAERDTSLFQGSKEMEVGVLAHEIAAKEVANFYGIAREINNIEERFELDIIFKTQESIKYDKLKSYYGGHIDLIGVEQAESIQVDDVCDGFRVNVRFDAISRALIKDRNYIVIDDWKTGFQLSTEVDTEALIYAYVAYKTYNLPVIFRRISLFTGKLWTNIFSEESILKIESTILYKMKKYKEEMESEYIPEHKPGSHCVYCPFLRQCEGRKFVDSLNNKYKASLIAKAYSSKLESDVKNAAKELLNELPEGETVLIPFINGGYGAVAKTSTSFQLAKRKITNKDLIKLLVETGEIDEYMDALTLKINEPLYNHLKKDYGIELKEVVKTTVELKINEKEDENE